MQRYGIPPGSAGAYALTSEDFSALAKGFGRMGGLDRIATLQNPPDKDEIAHLILDQGVTWPWSSGDNRIADQGVTGDAKAASAQLGERILASIVDETRPILERLLKRRATR